MPWYNVCTNHGNFRRLLKATMLQERQPGQSSLFFWSLVPWIPLDARFLTAACSSDFENHLQKQYYIYQQSCNTGSLDKDIAYFLLQCLKMHFTGSWYHLFERKDIRYSSPNTLDKLKNKVPILQPPVLNVMSANKRVSY